MEISKFKFVSMAVSYVVSSFYLVSDFQIIFTLYLLVCIFLFLGLVDREYIWRQNLTKKPFKLTSYLATRQHQLSPATSLNFFPKKCI